MQIGNSTRRETEFASEGERRPRALPCSRALIVDDDAQVRSLLAELLDDVGCELEEFEGAGPALERIHAEAPDIIFLDLGLPDRNGHDVLEEIRSDPATRLLPVVILTGSGSREDRIRALREGATDFLCKPFSRDEVVGRVRTLLELKHFADEHEHTEHVILTLAKAIDARDPHTAGHSGRVSEYAGQIAVRMGLDTALRNEIRRGALLHDVGKIVVPDALLRRPDCLNPSERAILAEHPAVGCDLLSPIKAMRGILPIVYSHHERLDGSGYPDGICGEDLPLAVRIVTVADVFDDLTRAGTGAGVPDQASAVGILQDSLEALHQGVRKRWWDGEVVEVLRAVLISWASECRSNLSALSAESPVDVGV